jgi:hypothetical protein
MGYGWVFAKFVGTQVYRWRFLTLAKFNFLLAKKAVGYLSGPGKEKMD